jgi:hypothetical protein
MENKFKFKDWCKKLPNGVGEILEDEGFDSWLALSNAKTEDITTIHMKPGHRIATLALLSELQQGNKGPIWREACTRTLEEEEEVRASTLNAAAGDRPMAMGPPPPPTLDSLLHGHTLPESMTRLGGRVDLDPTTFLHTNRPGESALRITDFISFSDSCDQSIELSDGVSIQLPRSKPKLDSVTPFQWISANCRIQATLIQTGKLAGSDILDYLAYTTKVGEMATRYTWSSVLAYDDQYRKSQAAYGFRWGSDSQHLAMVALRDRQTTPQPPRRGHHVPPATLPRQAARVRAPSGREICVQWNKGHCRFAPRCQFEHCCSVCLRADHQAVAHPPAAPHPAATRSQEDKHHPA